MNRILVILTIATALAAGQEYFFEFMDIQSPQYVGDSFMFTVITRDPYGGIFPYNGSALLSTSKDDSTWSYVRPGLIAFRDGVANPYVVVTQTGRYRFHCFGDIGSVSGSSNWFEAFSGTPSQFLILLPGELHAPGRPTGKGRQLPDTQAVGVEFEFDVHVTDIWYNTVEFRQDSVYFGCTDLGAILPPGVKLVNGQATVPVTNRGLGMQRLFAWPQAGSPVDADTSSPYVVASPGVEEQGPANVERTTSPTILRAPELARFEGRVLDITGREVTDRRALRPGVYFLRPKGPSSLGAEGPSRKVILTK